MLVSQRAELSGMEGESKMNVRKFGKAGRAPLEAARFLQCENHHSRFLKICAKDRKMVKEGGRILLKEPFDTFFLVWFYLAPFR